MRFKKYGRTCHLQIESADDLQHVLTLDESLWVATSAPTSAFRCDPKLLALLDTDTNGRIYTNEVRDAARWLLDTLTDHSRLADDADALPLCAIRAEAPHAPTLMDSARYILRILDRQDADTISLDEVRTFLANLQRQPLNGDGILVPETAGADADAAAFIRDAIACVATEKTDASGKPGVGEAELKTFEDAIRAHQEWRTKGEIPEGESHSPVMPLGANTPGIYAVFERHADKIDLFFALCDAIAFEPRTEPNLAGKDAELQSRDFDKIEDLNACLAGIPIARPTPEGTLPLSDWSINPVFRLWIGELKEQVLKPVLGNVPEVLTPQDWQRVKAMLAPYAAYLTEKKGACVEALPSDKLVAYRDGPALTGAHELVAADRAVAAVRAGVLDLERLLLYHRYFLRFANNFVSFSELYDVADRAMFERGSAVIDGRWFNFAVEVDNVAQHVAIAKTSNIFTLYLDVTGKPDGAKFCVAVPATSGTKGNLVVGKRGIFFDTNGKDYDARVIQVIENPISIREALTAQFTRLWNFVIGKIEAMSGSSEKELQKNADALLKDPMPAAEGAAGGMPGGTAGLLMGVSVSAAAIGSAFAFITKTMTSMSRHQVGLGLLGAAAVVVVPVSLIAIIKLRRQDLSALLEGCGWAVNTRMRFDRAQRRQFTRREPYPEEATGTPRKRWCTMLILAAVALAILIGGGWAWKSCRPNRQPQATPAPTPASTSTPGAAHAATPPGN